MVQFEWRTDVPEDLDLPILCCTNNGKMIVFKNTLSLTGKPVGIPHSDYDWLREKYSIKCWVYCKDLIE